VRGSSKLVASGRHLHFAAFPSGSPLLVHLTSERARILPFNPSAFVGRAPFVAMPQTGDRLLPMLARVGAGLKIGFPSLNSSRQRHSCASPNRAHPWPASHPACIAHVRSHPAAHDCIFQCRLHCSLQRRCLRRARSSVLHRATPPAPHLRPAAPSARPHHQLHPLQLRSPSAEPRALGRAHLHAMARTAGPAPAPRLCAPTPRHRFSVA
jgi:hypothetical protein